MFSVEKTVTSRSKLNLRLKVEGRRDDGYHRLSMVNVETELSDIVKISITKGKSRSLRVGGEVLTADEITALSALEHNLLGRAAIDFLQCFKIDAAVDLELTKNIPPQSGLAGGSSNAGVMLRTLYNAAVSQGLIVNNDDAKDKLGGIAISLGADVPYFLYGGLAHVSGVGEVVEKIGDTTAVSPPCVVIRPPCGVGTKELFAEFRRATERERFKEDLFGRALSKVRGATYEDLLSCIENDLEKTVFALHPIIGQIASSLSAAPLRVGLTGSGSALFVLPESSSMGEEDLSRIVKERLLKSGARAFPTRLKLSPEEDSPFLTE